MLKKIGSWIGSIKRYVAKVQNEVSSLENEDFVNDNKNEKKLENNDTK
jgi:sec-independent protein translocase protein TatB